MKKFASSILTVLLLLHFGILSHAFEVKYYGISAPVIENTETALLDGDRKYTLTFSSDIDDTETLREFLYSTAADKYGSEEKLLDSPEAYLAKKTRNYCEISLDDNTWYTLEAVEENTFSFTLYDGVLPLLQQNGVDLSRLSNGFDFYVRMLTASENFKDENVKTVYVHSEGKSVKLTAPSFGYINILLPEDAVFNQELPRFFSSSIEEDIILSSPECKGYIFDGWSVAGKEERIGKIAKGTRTLTLQTHWIAKEYEINYVITTNIEYSFGRADNSNNPVSYTFGAVTPIYDIRSPVGGFSFGGWYKTKDFSGEKITEISADETGDVILYAKWISEKEVENALRAEREKYMVEKHFGDIDNDGKITAADARFVLRYSVGLEEFSYELLKRVDYYNTDTVTALNARTTLRLSVGLDNLYDILLENGIFPE